MKNEFIYALLSSFVISGIISVCLGILGYLIHKQSQSKIIMTANDELKKSESNYKKMKKYNISFIFIGILMIVGGMNLDSVMVWVDQSTLLVIEICVADMHFRHNNETQFQECVLPDLEKIVNIQQLIIMSAAMYSVGGIFIGYGITKKYQESQG